MTRQTQEVFSIQTDKGIFYSDQELKEKGKALEKSSEEPLHRRRRRRRVCSLLYYQALMFYTPSPSSRCHGQMTELLHHLCQQHSVVKERIIACS